MSTFGLGVIGCGVISTTYLRNAPLFKGVAIRAVTDVRPEAAKAQADKFKVDAVSMDAMLSRKDIDGVINLTVPNAHFEVSKAALNAGKHVFSEKPITVTGQEAKALCDLADQKKLSLAVAPDTFLGPGHQLARKLIDDGKIGRVVAGTVSFLTRGMEHWHPDPTFFFKPGGGPVLDMGPYYITALVNLIGPVRRVIALTSMGLPERVVTAAGPMLGKSIKVETPTTVFGALQFESGALVSLNLSWDAFKHSARPIELHGTAGSMRVPDPNFFGGIVEVSEGRGDWQAHDTVTSPLGKLNHQAGGVGPMVAANYRMLGVTEMAAAIKAGRAPRASGRLAQHALDVMEAILKAGETGRVVEVSGGVRPAALSTADVTALLVDAKAVAG
jgi:predicted dehydrogenase